MMARTVRPVRSLLAVTSLLFCAGSLLGCENSRRPQPPAAAKPPVASAEKDPIDLPSAPEGPSVTEALARYREPETARGDYIIGLAYYRERDYAQAISFFEKSLRRTRKHPGVHFYLGFSHLARNEAEKARAAFEELTGFDLPPEEKAKVFAEIGAIHRDAQRDTEALAAYEKANRLDPAQFAAQFAAGILLAKRGQYSTAIDRFTTAARNAESAQERAQPTGALGEVWEKRSDGKADRRKALAFYEQALKMNPADGVAAAGKRRLSAER
jgi:hypothetical protein